MPNAFHVEKTRREGIAILSLDGFLDAHTAPLFETSIQEEVEAGQVRLIVDCSRLTYISSAGLGVFMSFLEEIREKKGDIKICSVIPKVRQVFEILGFPSLFEIVADIPEAIQRFSGAETEKQ